MTLYFGLDPSRFPRKVTHFPLIEIAPRPESELKPFFDKLPDYEKVIFTSRSSIPIYMKYACVKRPCIVVGRATMKLARSYGLPILHVAKLEQAEGILEILKKERGTFFFPHSSKARPLLIEYLKTKKALTFPLYDTVMRKDKIDLSNFEELVFTSPSTVEAFFRLYGEIPPGKKVIAIGPITAEFLMQFEKSLFKCPPCF